MRRALIVSVVTAAVLLAGCTSGTTTAQGTTAGTTAGTATGDPAEAARAPGVTADSIKIGVFYPDEQALHASGITLDIGDYKAAYGALIDQINAAGGIAGRKLDPTYVAINPVGTAPAQAACLQVTQDTHVFAVLGFFLSDAVLCPVQTEDTVVVGGMQTTALLAKAEAPWFTAYPGADAPEQAVKAFKAKGLLNGKVGVFAHTNDADLLNNQIMPELHQLGVDATKAELDAPDGDQSAIISGVQTIAQRFQAQGIDKVLLVGGSSEDWFLAMQNQSYRPKLLISDSTSVAAFLSNKSTTSLSLLEGAVEGTAYTQGTWVYDEPHLQACFAQIRKAGVDVPKPDPSDANAIGYTAAEDACTNVTLLKAILAKTGRTLNYATFRQAGYHLGTLNIPGDPAPHHFGPPPATDGSPPVHLMVWDPAKKAFETQGS